MRPTVFGAPLLILLCLVWVTSANSQEELLESPLVSASASKIATIKPNFLPPKEILDFLGVNADGSQGILEWETAEGLHLVEIRHHDAANLLIISGDATDVDFVEKLISEADIPPRQIEIEVKIVEISTSKAQDLGFDWEQILETSRPTASWKYSEDYSSSDRTAYSKDDGRIRSSKDRSTQDRVIRDVDLSAHLNLSQVLELLDESGVATIRNAPRILTLNNRRATILDGQRVTYVTRYSSYTNLFETDSMDAGLTLSVLPSLGESGYITLQINAELTTLSGSISNSPAKNGQMLENTVIIKNQESVLLGGLSRTIEQRSHRRFPILGHVFPFLFSREITIQEEIQSFIVLTPRVVDFDTAIDEETKSIIEGG